MAIGLDDVQSLTVLRDRYPVGALHIVRLHLDRPIRSQIKDPPVDGGPGMSGGAEVNSAVSVRRKIVRPDERITGLILSVGGEGFAIGGNTADTVVVVAGGEKFTLRGWDDGGRSATLLSP